MQYQHLITPTQSLKGNVAILFANDEKMLSVVIEALSISDIEVYLYDTQDLTEIIRSFDIEVQLLNRIHILSFSTKNELFQKCADDLTTGKVSLLMKGNMMSSTLLSFVLSHKHFIDNHGFLNHVACFDIPNYHKTLMLSDVAFNINPTVKEKEQIIINLSNFAKSLGYEQFKVGLLSSVEKAVKKIQSSIDSEKLKQIFHRAESNFLVVDGPFAFDNAVNMESVIKKHITSSVAGDVDALLVSHIDVGNALYKSFTYFGGARVSSLVLGANFPIVLTSRTDSKQNKLDSLLLALKVLN
ncbi:phosphate acyltransferase [Staphylococcus edaphicus]|uniref:Phosphate butyryltransferase n=1 Tax=Staphylococcus edaphicus TaxID=1955013 RepID=A0A2C6WPX0_9STAP|nr:phosphate acyltransferase [Staphylococcus edaphicus]PHK49786.1 phosphate butyryltransferase [Staphylococcus edaphicus]UQW80350.1 phosphate butyryltransferase [Staphylococcus edaphicus]